MIMQVCQKLKLDETIMFEWMAVEALARYRKLLRFEVCETNKDFESLLNL
jgi:hypothetical protein